MKKIFVCCFLLLISSKIFSQRFGITAFGSCMYHNFYDYDNSPHKGFKSGFQNGGGLNIFFLREGRNDNKNLRYTSIGFGVYSQETDSIIVAGHDVSIYYSMPMTFPGIQKTNYSFLSLHHTNFFKAKWNEFSYYLIGIQAGVVINKSKYILPTFDPAHFAFDHSVLGILPETEYGVFLGLHTGLAYEFEKFMVHIKVNYDWSFFTFQDYSLGTRWTADLGVSIPILNN